MNEIIVSDCIYCPFMQNDNEFGMQGCIFNSVMDELTIPKIGIHEECQLINNPVTIKVDLK